jgi:hypothetical protein
VYIRPFVEMLRREQDGERAKATSSSSLSSLSTKSLLFRSDEAPDRPWDCSYLTSVLKKATTEVWGRPVGTRLYRQLSIGITEKHVQEIHEPFNRYDDKSERADVNVVFAWQSGHRPIERASTYGLNGAFPTKLQPALLRLYEWASTRWHEFLHQASKVVALQGGVKRKDVAEELDDESGPGKRRRRERSEGGGVSQRGEQVDYSVRTGPLGARGALHTMADVVQGATPSGDDTFEYYPEYEVLLCLVHKQAIRSLDSHLRDAHRLEKERRQPLLEKYRSLALRHPKDVDVPPNGGPPFAALGKPLDGLLCNDCSHITISKDWMQRHCKEHGWRFTKRQPVYWTPVKVQTFFGTGFQKYFRSTLLWRRPLSGKEAVGETAGEMAA